MRRVAVTGLGLRTPAGGSGKELWNTLLAGRSTARPITDFDVAGLMVGVACQTVLDVEGYLTPKEARRYDRLTQLAVCAAADALTDAGDLAASPERRGVVTGSGFGGTATIESGMLDGRHPGRGNPGPLHVPMVMANAPAAAVSMRHDLRGPSMTVTTACASGGHAIGEAARLIRDGTADVMVAGGVEASVTATVLLAFDRSATLSRTEARPFDVERDGFALAEGAAFLVLEELSHARARGARIHAELAGYASTSDAYHLTASAPGGEGAHRCMAAAIADARLTPADITHVNAHGTGTRLNDLNEAQAITRLFGAGGVPVTSIKGVTGHAIGAAGAVEAVACVLSIVEHVVPPTGGLRNLDPACEIDAVLLPRPMPAGPVLSNSFGFGGHNAALVFTPV
ncbi:beta-ketoacyl-[acyl-carrier-protein] synthase family protein [Herbidospora sp. RD11066]